MATRPCGPAAVVLAALACGALVVPARARSQDPATGIRVEDLRAHVEMLASDALDGRAVGSAGLQTAATYVGTELARAGVPPLDGRDGYLDGFDLPESLRRRRDLPEDARGWNVTGALPGRRPDEIIVISAHLDHLGEAPDGEDRIFNGADDNASGVAAVLGLAAALARGPRLARTVLFVFFDGEEAGGLGSRHVLDAGIVPIDDIVAMINVEMVGRPNLGLPPDVLWLTGYDRTTLGPALADHGALVVRDPYPEQRFFERSDNYAFARRGVVAQTLSSFDLHRDYHSPRDDVSRIDFPHLAAVTSMLVRPLQWLAGGTFRPAWRPGGRPAPRPAGP